MSSVPMIAGEKLACWTIAFLDRGRPERTMTEQRVFARAGRFEADSA